MKNILALNGAAKKSGNSVQLLDAFIEGATSKGHHMETFYLQDMDVRERKKQ